jgi:hypothetical protein
MHRAILNPQRKSSTSVLQMFVQEISVARLGEVWYIYYLAFTIFDCVLTTEKVHPYPIPQRSTMRFSKEEEHYAKS